MVQPHLEYGNGMWGPVYGGDVHKVEKIQRRATNMIYSLKNLPYEQRLHTLKLPSLSTQRTINDWNKFPANVVDAPSLNAFKNRLDEHWKNSCYTTTVI